MVLSSFGLCPLSSLILFCLVLTGVLIYCNPICRMACVCNCLPSCAKGGWVGGGGGGGLTGRGGLRREI
jgi:hypothetical protein